jgi:hypothetical protein
MEKDTGQEIDLSKVSIPKELHIELLKAAEIYNYTKLENLLDELHEHSDDGKLVAKLIKKFLHQYNVEKIMEILNKTCQTS